MRRKSLTYFPERRAISNGFVREHRAEGRPTGIVDGLSKVGFAEAGGVNVANVNVTEPANYGRGSLMKVIAALVRNLGVEPFLQAFFVTALGLSQAFLGFAVKALPVDLLAIGQRGERRKAQVDSYRISGLLRGFCDLNAEVEVPVPASVLGKSGAIQDLAFGQGPRLEYPKILAVDFESGLAASNVVAAKRHPSRRLPSTPAQPRAITAPTGPFVNLARLQDGVGGNRELLRRPRSKAAEVEVSGPAVPAPNRKALRLIAKIPDGINRAGLRSKASRVFYPVAINDIHGGYLA